MKRRNGRDTTYHCKRATKLSVSVMMSSLTWTGEVTFSQSIIMFLTQNPPYYQLTKKLFNLPSSIFIQVRQLLHSICEPVKEEDEKPFVPPAELQLPKDMHIPSCVKQNARIEKTANFIAQHGIQMEIMLKTKQAGNQQFDFLHFEDELNPYYKHVVQMIKSGKYKPAEEDDDNKKKQKRTMVTAISILHFPQRHCCRRPPPPSKPIELPKVSIHDTPYGALIKSIQENTEIDKKKKKSIISQFSAVIAKNQAHTYHQAAYDADYQTQMMSIYHNNHASPGTETVTLPMEKSELIALTARHPHHGSSSKNPRSSKQNSISLKDKNSSKVPARAEGPNLIEAPPPDVEPIIDRMAMEEEKLREQVSENLSGSVTPTAKPPADEDTQKEIEEKLKDKLASAMKERISQSHKEKQLQMERKRKAAMFLNTIKTSQPSLPLPSNLSEESGEGPANPVVFEYDNQSMPQMISSSHSDRASSSSRSKKAEEAFTHSPSAYNLEKRSPNRPSPPRWPIRPAPWASLRERTPPWQRRNREMAFRRSRSRSPHWRDDKKERNIEDPNLGLQQEETGTKKRLSKNGSVPIISAEALKKIKGVVKSESADDLVSSVSRTTSQENSPAPLANTSRGSTPSRSSTEATSTASSDLMSKVRAMLKKSREMIRKEKAFHWKTHSIQQM
ncbi:hypothetical protein Btru_002526 [Bulinus truncatus]|nr:hypothetical protein Btru_002526 [Bulinus truncatus]